MRGRLHWFSDLPQHDTELLDEEGAAMRSPFPLVGRAARAAGWAGDSGCGRLAGRGEQALHTHTHMHACTHMCVYVSMDVSIHVCIYACMCLCMYVCVYVSTYVYA